MTQVDMIPVTELTYGMCRSGAFVEEPSQVPHWMLFHSMLNPENDPVTTVAFNPILMAQPTNYSTLYTTLLRMQEVTDILGFKNIPVFFDMGLLTKVMEIKWAKPDILKSVIPCDGGMHLVMSLFSGIGYLY